MRYAVVDLSNAVVNVVVWDGVSPFDPGPGLRLVRSDTLNVGDVVNS